MVRNSSNEIRFEPEALELASRIEQEASRLLTRSVEHARLRSGDVVLSQDVKAAMQDLLSDLQGAFARLCAGELTELELTDEDFRKLTALPFRRPDTVDSGDDDL